MRNGIEIWAAAERGTKTGDAKSANVMRLYALAQMLALAESAVLKDDSAAALQHLRQLEHHTNKLAALLEPGAGLRAAA